MGSNLFASAFSSYSIFFSSSNDAPVAEGEETNKNSWGKKRKAVAVVRAGGFSSCRSTNTIN